MKVRQTGRQNESETVGEGKEWEKEIETDRE